MRGKKLPKVFMDSKKYPREFRSDEFQNNARAVVKHRQIIEGRIHEEMGEEYDWEELSLRWWPHLEAKSMSNWQAKSPVVFEPYHFRREMVKDEDGGYCGLCD